MPPPSKPSNRPVDIDRLVAAHRAAVAFYQAHYRGSAAADYLAERIGPLPRGWRPGYAPRRPTLVAHLRHRGFTDPEILAAGLAHRVHRGRLTDRFVDRIMFCIRTPAGDPVGFIGRSLPASGGGPKYLNSPRTAIYDKGSLLLGLAEQRRAIAAGAVPVLVEGPLDVLAVAATDAGHHRFVAVAPCGTALTDTQLDALAAVTGGLASGLVTCFDGDLAGRLATVRTWELLRRYPSVSTRAAVLADGVDPADLYTASGAEALGHVLEHQSVPLLDAVLDAHLANNTHRLTTVEGRIAVLREIAPLTGGLESAQHLWHVVTRLTRQLDLHHTTVSATVLDAVTGVSPAPRPVIRGENSSHAGRT